MWEEMENVENVEECSFCENLRHTRVNLVGGPFIDQHLNCRSGVEKFTLLHIAVANYDLDLFNFLIARPGLDLDVPDARNRTPLRLAIQLREIQLARQLVERGATNYKVDSDGTSCFMSACMSSETLPVAVRIFERGDVDINEQDEDERTALHHACDNDLCFALLDFLIFYGADPRILDCRGETAFMVALRKQPSPDENDEITQCQRFLMEFEADINRASTSSGITPLLLAIRHETHLVREIIERGADVNYVSKTNSNALRCSLLTRNANAFRIIWPLFDYWQVYHYGSKPLLLDFFHDAARQDWLYCFDVVCKSDVIEHAVLNYIKFKRGEDSLVSEVLFAFLKRGYKEPDVYPYICLFLSYGATVTVDDIENVYIYVGDNNQTLNLILDMEFEQDRSWLFISHPAIMYDVSKHPNHYFNTHNFSMNRRNIARQLRFLPNLFQYCTPTEQFMRALDEMLEKLTMVVEYEEGPSTHLRNLLFVAYKTVKDTIYTRMGLVPSLYELCRNTVRHSICQNSDFITYQKYRKLLRTEFTLPRRIVDVLTFRIPIYDVQFDLPYKELEPYQLHWLYRLHADLR